jgi:hypothetical protein
MLVGFGKRGDSNTGRKGRAGRQEELASSWYCKRGEKIRA